jgi:hypothetical protein
MSLYSDERESLAERVGDFDADSRKPNVDAGFARNRLRTRDLATGGKCPSFSSFSPCYRILFLQWHSKWCSTQITRERILAGAPANLNSAL